ncbi:MAG: hypothetical protein ACRDWY_07755, partial [Actinomycetes bacterium]
DSLSPEYSLRINAQSSKVITFQSWISAHFSSVTSAQFSRVIDKTGEPVSAAGCSGLSDASAPGFGAPGLHAGGPAPFVEPVLTGAR